MSLLPTHLLLCNKLKRSSEIELLLHVDQPTISDNKSNNPIIALLNANLSASSIYSNTINTHTKCMILKLNEHSGIYV